MDTKQLLGLIKEGDEKEAKREFSYEDLDVEDQDGETANQHKSKRPTLKITMM